MKKLDLVKINSYAPYAVKEDTQEGAYTFIADSGAEFSIGFMPDDLIQSDESYEFIIGNLNGVKSPRDKNVKATVIAIVEEFFNANKATMLFLCSTSDGKQLMRGRLFKNWFDTYKYRNTQYRQEQLHNDRQMLSDNSIQHCKSDQTNDRIRRKNYG